jgi:MFS family permease
LIWLLLHEPPRGAAELALKSVTTRQTGSRRQVKWTDVMVLLRIRSWRWLLVKEMLEAASLALLAGWSFTWLDSLGLGQTAIIVVLLMMLSIVAGAVFFGWVSDHLERKYPNRGRTSLVWLGLLLSLPVVILLVSADGHNVFLLMFFGILFGLGSTASGDSVMWPIIQGILAPELRGSGRALINMAKGAVSALMLTLSGLVADQVGVAMMLMYIIPGPLFISIFAWLPVFRIYPRDREALQQRLAQQRDSLLEKAEWETQS